MSITLVDRLILRIWLTYFLGGTAIAVTFIYAVDILANFDIQKGVITLLINSINVWPLAFDLFIPYAGFMATLLTIINISKSYEIMALKASGLSILTIIRSVIIFSVLVIIFLYFNQSYLARWLNTPTLYSFFDNNPTGWYYSKDKLINIKDPSLLAGKAASATAITLDFNRDIVSYIVFSDLTKEYGYWRAKKVEFLVSMGNQVYQYSASDYLITGFDLEELLQSPSEPTVNKGFYDLYVSWQNTQLGQQISNRSFLFILDKISYLLGFINIILSALAFSNINVRSGSVLVNLAKATFVYYLYFFLDRALLFLAKDQIIDNFLGTFGANIFLIGVFIWFLLADRHFKG